MSVLMVGGVALAEEAAAPKEAAAPAAKAAPPQWVAFDGKDNVSRATGVIGPDGTFHVFVRRDDNKIWYKKGQLAWQQLPSAFNATVEPAAIMLGQEVAVFSRSKSGKLWWAQTNGGKFGPWANLSGELDSKPILASTGEGKIDVFVRATDDTLRRIAYTGGNWSPWENLGGVVRVTDIRPAVGKNTIDLFVSRKDGQVWHLHIDRP
jgi:hypothetical protein